MSGVLMVTGCLPGARRGGMLVSSVQSDYSPTISFKAAVRIGDSVRIRIDRATLIAPGEVFEGMGAITGNLTMQALLVTAAPQNDPANEQTRNGRRKTWMERSASEPQMLADSLRMGVPRTVRALHFSLPLPQGVDARNSWLVFRISGPSVGTAMRMADGEVRPARVDANGIRVFACAMQNLNGKTDAARAEQLRTSYNEWC